MDKEGQKGTEDANINLLDVAGFKSINRRIYSLLGINKVLKVNSNKCQNLFYYLLCSFHIVKYLNFLINKLFITNKQPIPSNIYKKLHILLKNKCFMASYSNIFTSKCYK